MHRSHRIWTGLTLFTLPLAVLVLTLLLESAAGPDARQALPSTGAFGGAALSPPADARYTLSR